MQRPSRQLVTGEGKDPKKVKKVAQFFLCLWSIYIQCEAYVRALDLRRSLTAQHEVGNQLLCR